jgi:hypothetical protein
VATTEPVVIHHGREARPFTSRRRAADCCNGLLGGVRWPLRKRLFEEPVPPRVWVPVGHRNRACAIRPPGQRRFASENKKEEELAPTGEVEQRMIAGDFQENVEPVWPRGCQRFGILYDEDAATLRGDRKREPVGEGIEVAATLFDGVAELALPIEDSSEFGKDGLERASEVDDLDVVPSLDEPVSTGFLSKHIDGGNTARLQHSADVHARIVDVVC